MLGLKHRMKGVTAYANYGNFKSMVGENPWSRITMLGEAAFAIADPSVRYRTALGGFWFRFEPKRWSFRWMQVWRLGAENFEIMSWRLHGYLGRTTIHHFYTKYDSFGITPPCTIAYHLAISLIQPLWSASNNLWWAHPKASVSYRERVPSKIQEGNALKKWGV